MGQLNIAGELQVEKDSHLLSDLYVTGIPYISGSNYRSYLYFAPKSISDGYSTGYIRYNMGDNTGTAITDSRFIFLQRSYTADSNDVIGYYDYFSLPSTPPGLTKNRMFDILTTANFNLSSSSWTAGTTAGPKLNLKYDDDNIIHTTAAIPAASNSASGVVTTGGQIFAGAKTFTGNVILKNSAQYPAIYFYPSSASGTMGSIQNALTITDGVITGNQMQLVQWSYTANSLTKDANYEVYTLPSVTAGRTSNAVFEIFTSKNYTTLDSRYVNVTGDTMSGNLDVIVSDNSGTRVRVGNSNGKIALYVSTNKGLWDTDRQKWLIYTYTEDNTTRFQTHLYPDAPGTLNFGSNTCCFNSMYANGFRLADDNENVDVSYGNLRIVTTGTTDTQGVTQLNIGNSVAAGNAGNAYGRIYFGSTGAYGNYLFPVDGDVVTENKYFYFPNEEGTLVTHPTRGTAVGSSSKPVYVNSNGQVAAISSLNLSGTVKCTRLIATSTTDASETSSTNVALTLGDTSGYHLILDGNEIIAKNGASSTYILYLGGSQIEANGIFRAASGFAINTASYGTDESEISSPITGQVYFKYI